jgi:hypothetical protein
MVENLLWPRVETKYFEKEKGTKDLATNSTVLGYLSQPVHVILFCTVLLEFI